MDIKIFGTFSIFICINVIQFQDARTFTSEFDKFNLDTPSYSDSDFAAAAFERENRATKIFSKNFISAAIMPEESDEKEEQSGSESLEVVKKNSQVTKPCAKLKSRKKTANSKPVQLSESEIMGTQNTLTAGGSDYVQAILDAINFYRDEHGVPPLKLDAKLTEQALAHAKYLANTDKFEHSCKTRNCPYGENVSFATGDSNSNWANVARKFVNRWYNEITKYNFKSAKPDLIATGHFTQMIWKVTKKVGIGMAQSPKTQKFYLVTQFTPPGNTKNGFRTNVLPKG